MTIDVRTPEDKQRETMNVALITARKKLKEALVELEYLILATPSGARRNALTEANIHASGAVAVLGQLRSIEKHEAS